MRSFEALAFMFLVLQATGWVANVSGRRPAQMVQIDQVSAVPGGAALGQSGDNGDFSGGQGGPASGQAGPAQGQGGPAGGEGDAAAGCQGGAAGGGAAGGDGNTGGQGGDKICKSESKQFKGFCFSNQNYADICSTEGFQTGKCSAFHEHCRCSRPC